jgi:hypothetical protein
MENLSKYKMSMEPVDMKYGRGTVKTLTVCSSLPKWDMEIYEIFGQPEILASAPQ